MWLANYNGTTFAVKELIAAAGERGAAGQPPPLSAAAKLREIEREAQLVAGVRHPHVLAFMGVCLEPPCLVTGACTSLLVLPGGAYWAHHMASWVARLPVHPGARSAGCVGGGQAWAGYHQGCSTSIGGSRAPQAP